MQLAVIINNTGTASEDHVNASYVDLCWFAPWLPDIYATVLFALAQSSSFLPRKPFFATPDFSGPTSAVPELLESTWTCSISFASGE